MSRRKFLIMVGAAGAVLAGYRATAKAASGGGTIAVQEVKPGEDVFAYVNRVKGKFDHTLYQQVIGAANDFKEGDQAIGVGAADRKRVTAPGCPVPRLTRHPRFGLEEARRVRWEGWAPPAAGTGR